MRPTYEKNKKEYENCIKPILDEELTNMPQYSQVVKSICTCFKEKVEDGWTFSGEYHEMMEMVYVTSGHIFVSVDGKTKKLEQGELAFFLPMEFHQMWCENCPHAKFMVISFFCDSKLLEPLGENTVKLDIEKKEELSSVYNLIHESFDANLYVLPKPDSLRNTIAERLCYNKLEHFLLSLLNKKIQDEQKHLSIGNMNYKLIIDTMNENINKNLTIEDLANLCNLSVSNLKKTFSKYGNDGVMRYFNRMKIQRAIRFLRGGYSASQIANEMGFSSQNYFSVVFKRETGMLPSEFKKKNM